METHVKVLGILNIVSGVFGLCGDPDAAFALPLIGLTGLWVLFSQEGARLFTSAPAQA